MDVEQLKEQVDIRNKQIEVMLKVLQQDLPDTQLRNIMRRIKDEAPTIKKQDSKQWFVGFTVNQIRIKSLFILKNHFISSDL